MPLLISNGQAPVGLPSGGVNDNVVSRQAGSPTWSYITTLLDNLFGSSRGTVLFRGAANWQGLAAGVSGQSLTTAGPAADPTWSSIGRPTAGSLGVNNVALTGGDLTLTDVSDAIQVVTAVGGFNKINLPTPTTASPVFVLINNGLASLVVQFAGEANRTITVGSFCVCYPNPTLVSWFITATQTFAATTYYAAFGPWQGPAAGTVAAGSYPWVSANIFGTNQSVSLTTRSEYIAHAACTLDAVAIDATALGGGNWAIYKNGIITPGPNGVGPGTLSFVPIPPVSLVAGDRIGIQNSSPGAGTLNLIMFRALFLGAPGYKLFFAGNLTSPFGAFNNARPWQGYATGGAGVAPVRLPRAMTLTAATWGAQSASTTFEFYKNGVFATSLVIGATQGLAAIGPVAYAAGDTCGVSYTAGTIPGDTHIEPIFTGIGSAFAGLSVDYGATAGFFCRMQGTSNRTSFVALRSGSPLRAAWASTSHSGSQGMEIYKNGIATGVTITGTAGGTATLAAVSFTVGDALSVRMNSQTGVVSNGVLDLEWGPSA